jgi:hypothetical protein
LLYGVKVGHPLNYSDDISILEGKIAMITAADVGQVDLCKFEGTNYGQSNFTSIALFSREEFILFLSKGDNMMSYLKYWLETMELWELAN